MKKITLIAAAAALALSLGANSAVAQRQLVGIQSLDDRLEDIERDVREDQRRAEDRARFGSEQLAPG